jgi:hypothetical protein
MAVSITPILRLPASSPMASARPRPTRRKSSVVTAIIPSAMTKVSSVMPAINAGSAIACAVTPSMVAIANSSMPMTLSPSIFSRSRSRNSRPRKRRTSAAAAADPAIRSSSLNAKPSGEISAVPRKTCVNKVAVNGAIEVETIRLASVSATSSPSSAAIAGADIRPGAAICSTSMK